jgi:hypothetical protein
VHPRRTIETVGTLAGGIAHDFNNILGGILAHSELALAELGNGTTLEQELPKIRAVAISGSEIVRPLLKHAAVETDLGKNLPGVRTNRAQVREIVTGLTTIAPLTGSGCGKPGRGQLEVFDSGRGMTPTIQSDFRPILCN